MTLIWDIAALAFVATVIATVGTGFVKMFGVGAPRTR